MNKEHIENLKEVRREIRRINHVAGQTIFNPAATDALDEVLRDNGVISTVVADGVMFMTVGV